MVGCGVFVHRQGIPLYLRAACRHGVLQERASSSSPVWEFPVWRVQISPTRRDARPELGLFSMENHTSERLSVPVLPVARRMAAYSAAFFTRAATVRYRERQSRLPGENRSMLRNRDEFRENKAFEQL